MMTGYGGSQAISALVVFGVLMSMARSNAGRGSDEPPNDQGALMPSDDSDSQSSTSDEELRAKVLAHSNRYGSVENLVIAEDEVATPAQRLHHIGYRDQLLRFIAMTGEFFAVMLERDVIPRWPGQGIPNDALPVSLFQLERCTMRVIMLWNWSQVMSFLWRGASQQWID